MADLTDTPPVRRMAVARAVLVGAADMLPDAAEDALVSAAAFAAVRQAPIWIASADPAQPTHIDIGWHADAADLVCTCTVQAFARSSLAQHALLGAATAAITLAGPEARFRAEIVQEVS